ncbi:MAG TPA: alpha-amylase family glycosyl hydrolase [Terriglobia bacterium]|nr:alpha-amylase family glycosyl hydrolase [Terriglobia bacterium]
MATSLFSPDFLTIFNSNRDTGGPLKAFASPADWRDQLIYFLMVDRFNNSQAPPRHVPFDDPKYSDFQGGNLASIQDKLPYIKQLGAGAIWLSPVLKNMPLQPGTYHGYGIHDFLHVDPRFARDPNNADNELRSLVDAAHNLGLYVILDIVLNHTGDAFAYVCDAGETNCINNQGAQADFRPFARPIQWRDPLGNPRADWPDIATIPNPPIDALVWPSELHQNDYFRRQGTPGPDDDTVGDFDSLKQFRTDLVDLQQFLVRCYQYVIARFDIDGYRIDTLRYLKNNLPLLFGNSIREYALSIGKKNFFTFGEVFVGDAEEEIARFIGRTTTDNTDMVGVDAALDYPLLSNLKPVVKGFAPPSTLVSMYVLRKKIEADVLSSHGDATRYFVTFLDNHDVKERIRYVDPANPTKYDDQVTLGLACLYSLPGIPCLYYGTEQGLHGVGSDPAVREALWGGPGFAQNSVYYQHISQIAAVRRQAPALRYGRFYFRPVSGDKQHFGVSTFVNGSLAFSRILMDQEIVIVANTDTVNSVALYVIVDITLNNPGDQFRILYSNKAAPQPPTAVLQLAAGAVQVQETDGSTGTGPLNCMLVTLAPLEVQILGR